MNKKATAIECTHIMDDMDEAEHSHARTHACQSDVMQRTMCIAQSVYAPSVCVNTLNTRSACIHVNAANKIFMYEMYMYVDSQDVCV